MRVERRGGSFDCGGGENYFSLEAWVRFFIPYIPNHPHIILVLKVRGGN